MSKTINSTPKADGFRMPGEFEEQTQIWTGWPVRGDVWPGFARPVQKTMREVILAITEFEPVTVLCCESHYDFCRNELPQNENIRIVEMSYDDAWLRDIGTTFVVNDAGEIRGVDWEFNAWGGLEEGFYFPWDKDNKVAKKILEIERADRYKADFVLEGGSIHCDGEGTILTTEECLLEHNSNPHMIKEDYTKALCDYLGDDEQYAISREVYEFLSRQTDAKGRKFDIHKIHQPNPLYTTQEEVDSWAYADGTTSYVTGDRIAASYINFLIVNGGIIAPSFGDSVHDAEAKKKLEELFPERKVVQVYSRQIVLGGGCIHCMTQQQPKAYM